MFPRGSSPLSEGAAEGWQEGERCISLNWIEYPDSHGEKETP